ncbi:YceI family protein [Phenylobacterium sp.]|jgi:polyisoprenoid-binding protein YceI|uniref:YceI family protein n=1 Tax=Phenylobacterium sp. TaxID=1871053 RepID=UPI002F415C7B
MKTFRTIAAAKALGLALVAGPAIAATAAAPQPPAGTYTIDKAHTSVTFRVSHLGFSHYTARFSRIDGKLRFDPAHPAAMSVEATIDPMSLALNAPPKGFHQQLMGKGFFEAAKFPTMTFKSTRVDVTGANTARVTGNLTLHGVTRPVVLDVTYNGGYPPMAMDPGGARVGFSAHTMLKRSAFGISQGLPAPGSNMGVGDDVDVAIETEFNGGKPPAAPAKK